MMNYSGHFRSDEVPPSLDAALGYPVAALLGVTEAAAAILAEIGVRTVFDLGASALFAKAGMVAEASSDGSLATLIGSAPGDWLTETGSAGPLEDLGGAPIAALRGLNADQAERLASALGIVTIRDLAHWPPRRAAHSMVAAAAGSSLSTEVIEPGEELRPRLGEFPTERVYYDRLVMLSHGGPEATAEIEGPISLDPALAQPFGFGRPAVGVIATFSQSWFAKGVTLGQMLHSLALAPGEATRIAVIDWARRTSASVEETIAQREQLDSATAHSRAISEVQNAVATEMQEGKSMSSGWARSESEAEAGTGSSGLIESLVVSGSESWTEQSASSRTGSRSTSWSSGTRSVVAEMAQDVNDRTEQHSNSVRNRRASAVREVSQSEHEEVSTRIVANYNHMHALTVQYYEVVQVYRVETRLHQAIRCLFLPFEMPDFSGERGRQMVERFRSELLAAALTPRVRNLLREETADVELRPVTKITLPGATFPLDEAITSNEMASMAMAATSAAAGDSGAATGETAPPTPVTKPIVWSGSEIASASLAVGRTIVRQGRNSLFLPENTELLGISFSGLNIGRLRLERAGPDDAVYDLPSASARVDLPPGTRLSSIDALLVARAANDSLFAGTMTLHCSYLGRPFSAPGIALQLTLGTQMQKVLHLATDRSDRQKELQEHLQANATHYGQAILSGLRPATLMSLLSGFRWNGRAVVDLVEPDVVAVAGNYVVLRAPAEDDEPAGASGADAGRTWSELIEERGLVKSQQDSRTVPIPTDGVFAEAVLGRSNSAEKLDITRFWNWQDSPIPLQPPEIAPVGTGSRGTAESLTPGDLSSPVLNIVNPTSLPDPAGLSAGLSALATSNLFRDMSGLAGTQTLAGSALEQATQAAGQAGQLASTNLQTEAQKAVAMGQIAADIAKAAMGNPGTGSTSGISADGAKINQGRDMDERGVGASGSSGTSGSVSGSSGSSSGGGSAGGGSSGGSSGSSSAGGGGDRMPGPGGYSNEAAYSDQSGLGYSPDALARTLEKTLGLPAGTIQNAQLVTSKLDTKIPVPGTPRPCCILHPSPPIVGKRNIIEVADVKTHFYDGGLVYKNYALGTSGSSEASGLVYTCKGGFVDLGHGREWADWTRFVAHAAKQNLFAGGTVALSNDVKTTRSVTFTASGKLPDDELCILLGQRIAYEMAVWHELATWQAQRASCFSPEDNYSNLIGTYWGADAIRATKGYDAAMVDAIKDWLNKLGALARADTEKAFEEVKEKSGVPGWWRDVSVAGNDLIRRRHFDALGTVTPWLVGLAPAGFAPCVGAEAHPLDVPQQAPDGTSLASLYTLSLDGAGALEPDAQALTIGKGAAPVTPADYPKLIDFVRAEAKKVFGPKADQPH